jgi:hypothetical protein
MNTADIYQLFINFNVPGVRKEVARLAQGVNMGDAGVINEALQAAYDPSAGQQALQAGEQVQQPCIAFDQQALVSAIATSVGSAMVSSMSTYLVKQDAREAAMSTYLVKQDAREAAMSTYLVKQDAKETAFHDSLNTLVVAIKENHDVVQQNLHIMDEKLADADAMNAENKADTDAKMAETDAKIADNKAETDAKMAEIVASADAKIADNKAETDAKIAEIVASADAKMAEIVNALSKVATGSATDCVPDAPAEIMNALSKVASGSATGSVPDAPAKLPMRKYKKYTTESKKITLQWVMKNISYPYADIDELEMLQKKTGVDTIDRMRQLIKQLRTKEMVQDKHGKWCRRTTTKPSVVGNKRSWTQKNINDMM